MKFNYLFAVIFSFLTTIGFTQVKDNEVLLTVEGEDVLVSDFTRVYNKNLNLISDESKNDIDEYLDLFINFKLKLKEAEALKLNENPSYISEFNSYKSQLTSSYLTDSKVTDELIEEAYNHTVYNVKANHILVRVDENASPQDSLNAYKEIVNYRERALKEGFEKVRKEIHNGKTIYGEELGYFSAFKMVYAFEKVAFNTPVGEISQPFRTRFGYHIVKVLDKRKSEGKRTVAHIMLVQQKPGVDIEKPEVMIQDLYKQLNEGADFKDLAKKYSQDQSTSEKGGELSPISRGQIAVQEFEDVAFSLQNVGDISEPFKTKFGWHIVKLLDKQPVRPFEDMKAELSKKVERDSRSKLIDEAFFNKLKSQYEIVNKPSDLDYFVSILNKNYYSGKWAIPSTIEADKPFLKIEDKQYTYQDFADYLAKTQRQVNPKKSFEEIVDRKYNVFLNNKLVNYKKERLEFENKDYANILKEYREGLLLFDIMSSNIWNTVESDSLQIQEFYNANKNNYLNSKTIDAVVASSSNKKAIKKVAKSLKKGKELKGIESCVNKKYNNIVTFTSDTLSVDAQNLPKDLNLKKGVSEIYNNNSEFVVLDIKDIFAGTQKTFDEARAEVVSDYQAEKEKKWLDDLRSKYKVVLNQDVYNRLKSQLKKG